MNAEQMSRQQEWAIAMTVVCDTCGADIQIKCFNLIDLNRGKEVHVKSPHAERLAKGLIYIRENRPGNAPPVANWQQHYRRLAVLESRAGLLARELDRFREALKEEMAALAPPAVRAIAERTERAMQDLSKIQEGGTYKQTHLVGGLVCNFEFQVADAYCDLYAGHEKDGFDHYSHRPRTFVPKREAITLEEAIKLHVRKGIPQDPMKGRSMGQTRDGIEQWIGATR
jgi:hypothetical protein